MPILLSSNRSKDDLRVKIASYLSAKKQANPDLKVIDIGSRHNDWAEEFVTAFVDLIDFKSDKKKYLGDMNEETVWEEINKDGPFDFAICSHVLEDIRNPVFVLNKIRKIAKAGYIATPNKHIELSIKKSEFWLGVSHHRWIFTLQNNNLFFMPKWPCVAYYNQTKEDEKFGKPILPWMDKNLCKEGFGLGFLWEGSFDFSFEDYYHDSAIWQVNAYRDLLAEGL